MAIYTAAGAYLLYLAWKMLEGISANAGTSYVVSVIALVVFGISGAGLVIFGIYSLNRLRKAGPADGLAEKSEQEEDAPEGRSGENEEKGE